MALPEIDTGSFMRDEALKADGSNFIGWYGRLRTMLERNGLLHVIREPLGDEPESYDDLEEFGVRRDTASVVQWTMLFSMDADLRERFRHTDAYETVDELKTEFDDQVRMVKYECLDKFLSCKMEENTCLESHLRLMHRIHEELTVDWDYWMTDQFAIDGVLRSLPPSYKEVVRGYVMGGITRTFHQFVSQLRTVKVEPIAGEIIDETGIFDIPL